MAGDGLPKPSGPSSDQPVAPADEPAPLVESEEEAESQPSSQPGGLGEERTETKTGEQPDGSDPNPPGNDLERTPIDVASTLQELPSLDDDDDEHDDRTVEALTPDAFGDESDRASLQPVEVQELDEFAVPTRRAAPDELERLQDELDRSDDFLDEHTTVSTLDGSRLDRVAARAEQAGDDGSPAEAYYRDMVEEEISFSKATGYDREGTAVVPLAELARREEERLAGGDLSPESTEPTDEKRAIPVGEIIDVLRAARTVEEVAGVLVEIVSNLIPRVLLMWDRHGRLYGFASRGMDLTEVKLLTIEIPRGVLQQMCAADLDLEAFQGPPRTDEMVERFFDLLGQVPPEVLLIPIQVTARDRWLLYADNRADPLPEFELRLLEVIASRAGARADWLLDKQSIW